MSEQEILLVITSSKEMPRCDNYFYHLQSNGESESSQSRHTAIHHYLAISLRNIRLHGIMSIYFMNTIAVFTFNVNVNVNHEFI